MSVRKGPSRTCMLDDLCFYIQNYSALLAKDDPDSVAVFAKKIIASHYLQHFQYLRAIVSDVQFHISRQDRVRLDYFSPGFVEAQWSDTQALERRMSEYCEDLESIMLQCHIPFELSNSRTKTAWRDTDTDFQFLYARFKDIRHRAEMLNSAVTGLASMSGNRQALQEQELSLREAKSTKALTLLGLIFIPLAYVGRFIQHGRAIWSRKRALLDVFCYLATPNLYRCQSLLVVDSGYSLDSKGKLSFRAVVRANK